MKLPNFFNYAPLVSLKLQMGIPYDVYGDFSLDIEPGRLTTEELNLLISGEGIDVPFNQLTVLPDGTLAYKDSRVLLYIRDVHIYGRETELPRYHLSNCSTLQEMNKKDRFHRYVIATQTKGIFKVNFISGGKIKSKHESLLVCQNCLHGLEFDGFRLQMDPKTRARRVSEFTPDRFFELYPRSLHVKHPVYDSDNAPIDDYTSDFPEKSTRLRLEAGWMCSECKRVLDHPKCHRYLHVHHINGDRRDNRETNLRVLCIRCHANQPNHHHMKTHPRYREFLADTNCL